MKPKDGRKALVVFSDGEDRGSKETLNDAIDAADHANLAVYTIYFKGEQERQMGNGFPGGGRRGGGGMGGGWPGGGGGYPGGGGGYPGGGGGRRRRRREQSRRWTARRSWSRLPPAPAAGTSRPRRRTTWKRSTTQIAEELRGQYLLTYTPDKVDNDERVPQDCAQGEERRSDGGRRGKGITRAEK